MGLMRHSSLNTTAWAFARGSFDQSTWHRKSTQRTGSGFARLAQPTHLPAMPAPDDAGAATRRQVTTHLSVPRLPAARPAEIASGCGHPERAAPARIGHPVRTGDEAAYRTS